MRSVFFFKGAQRRARRIALASITLSALALAGSGSFPAAHSAIAAAPSRGRKSPTPKPSFARDIAPIFQTACVKCHGAENAQAKLRLDSEAAVLAGGVSGRMIVPGDSQESLLVKRLLGLTDAPRMPLGAEALTPTQVGLIRAWIDGGTFSGGSLSRSETAAVVPANHKSQIEDHKSSPRAEPRAAHVQSAGSPLFASQIRPILAERCYQCHGPNVQQHGLRLDSLQAALQGSETGKVIIPGEGEKSPLVRRLMALDRPQMPYGGPPLSADQIKLIRDWIDRGAPGPDSSEALLVAGKPTKHWAYIKPVRPELPAVQNKAWCRNPIDYFVLARLEKEGLKPSPEADRATLIRRVYLDLIGLPPTPEQVDAFVADKSSDAYEKVVDQLLASPRYGEKWAAEWLDLARYADSNGYEKDNLRVAWKYRDWVINAFNQDMSFKEFTIEQIAGDMLPNPTTDQLIATGFHRNTMLNQEGGVDHEEYRFYSLIDRVNTTASVWLGLTLGCAQCHNHKFDPFTQRDYYKFLAFFDNVQYKDLNLGQGEGHILEPELELPTPEQDKKAKEIRGEMAKFETALDTETPELEAAQAKWEAEMRAAEKQWTTLAPSRADSAGGAALRLLPDHSILASGKNPDADTYTVETRTELKGITGVRIEVLSDPSLPNGGPGRDPDGNFFLSDFEIDARPVDGGAAQAIQFKNAEDDEAQGGYEINRIVSKKDKQEGLHGWVIDDSLSRAVKTRQAVLVPEKRFGFDGGTLLTIHLKHRMLHAARNIGRFRLSITTMDDALRTVKLSARLRPVLDMPAAQRSEEQKNQLASAYRSIAPALQPVREQITKLKKALNDVGIVSALIVRERPGFDRPSTFLHIRGAYLSKGERVYAEVPAILNPLPPSAMPNRLGLAEWLVSDDNPLTARVTVNHYWEQVFGHGIVETAEDFGTQGEAPTHPELLDWLATEFMGDGWSMKKILRTIVTSATYRQSSRVTPELEKRDPYNKLLGRGPRFRVSAETVRDIALAASGLLSSKIGGPSVFPYQPEGVWGQPYSGAKWIESQGEDRYRRGAYTFIRRTSPYPSLITFDAPSREFCTVRRVRTNTPLQALTTLNDPVFFDAARALAGRVEKEAGADVKARATRAFRLCVSRRPTRAELDRIVAFYQQELDHYRGDLKAAADVLGGSTAKLASAKPGASTVHPQATRDDAEKAAWTVVANVLLNLDETITKE